MSTKKVITGILAGAAVGALAGILLAPDKGSNTRKKISGKVNDVKDSLKGQFDEAVEIVKNKYGNVKQEVEDAASQLKTKAKETKEEAQATF